MSSSPPAGESSSQPDEIFFYKPIGPHGFLSQWYRGTGFTAPVYPRLNLSEEMEMALKSYISESTDHITFSCAEQYMMLNKAIMFDDTKAAVRIMKAVEPARIREIGRNVEEFDDEVWMEHAEAIVEEGNWAKFTAHLRGGFNLGPYLLETGNSKLVEAVKGDFRWAIGFEASRAGKNRAQWGLNLLGSVLMRVRDRLREDVSTSVQQEEAEAV